MIIPWTDCSDPPEESCADACCPIHGWTDDVDADADYDDDEEIA